MQILFLSIIAKCGVFTHVKELAQSLQKKGHNIIVGLIDNYKTRRLFSISDNDKSAMTETLKDIPYFCFSSADDLLKKIKTFDLDIVHTHSPILFSTSKNVSRLKKAPLVITLHGLIKSANYYHSLMEAAESIIAIGPEVAKSVCPRLKNRIQIIYNGIDIDRYKPGDTTTYEKPLRIIWIGRTSGAAAKGAEFLAKAINMLRRKGIEIDARMLGIPLGADVRGMKLCGWVQDPLEHLQWSHIAFARGRALREAMACGNVGFLLAEGYGGIVRKSWFYKGRHPQLSGSIGHGCMPLSVERIAKDILAIYQNMNRLENARKTARKIAEENFDINKMAEKTCQVYENALKQTQGAH